MATSQVKSKTQNVTPKPILKKTSSIESSTNPSSSKKGYSQQTVNSKGASRKTGSASRKKNKDDKKYTKATTKQPGIPPEEEIRAVFELFDKDGNGTVDVQEIKDMMSLLGQSTTQEELRAIMEEVDKDKNGVLDYDEFKVLMTKCLKDDKECYDEIFEAFTIFDKDGSGYIDRGELEMVLKNCGEKLTMLEMNEVFDAIDKDGNGLIDYDEFCAAMTERLL